MLNPAVLCQQHLLGEHNELHKLAGSIEAGHSLDGYLEQNIMALERIGERHAELVIEMERRDMNHQSPLEQPDVSAYPASSVDRTKAMLDLSGRCEACKRRLAQANAVRVTAYD